MSRKRHESPAAASKEKVSLWGLVLLGFLASLALVGALSYVFAAYTTQSLTPLGNQQTLTTDRQSGVS